MKGGGNAGGVCTMQGIGRQKDGNPVGNYTGEQQEQKARPAVATSS